MSTTSSISTRRCCLVALPLYPRKPLLHFSVRSAIPACSPCASRPVSRLPSLFKPPHHIYTPQTPLIQAQRGPPTTQHFATNIIATVNKCPLHDENKDWCHDILKGKCNGLNLSLICALKTIKPLYLLQVGHTYKTLCGHIFLYELE